MESEEREVDQFLSSLPEANTVPGRVVRFLLGALAGAIAIGAPLIFAFILDANETVIRWLAIITTILAILAGIVTAVQGDRLLRRLLLYVRSLPSS